MTDTLTAWVDNYLRAWESNDPEHIRSLFTEDGEYSTEPYAEPWQGHDEIIEGWLDAADEPGETTFEWTAVVSTPELGIVQGTTVYGSRELTYSNLWVIRFAPDGRATEFVEWWMEQAND